MQACKEFYRSKTEVSTFKAVFESFFREQYVASNGIDAFVDILNLEEKKRDRKSSPHRFFLFSTMMPDIFYDEEKYTDDQRLKIFASNFEDMLNRYEVKKLESVDLVFIPVLQGDHFYVLCFNLKTGVIELIDNSAAKQEFKERYKGLPDTLRRLLVLYLQNALKPTPAIQQLATSVIERKEMDWRTKNNGVDCGVFMMRHLETYKGDQKPWATGFVNEDEVNNRQKAQLHLLRTRYLSKIILSEHNMHRLKIIKMANAFDKMPDKERYMKDLDKEIPERMKIYFGRGN
ncbi:putative Ulp1 protease family catalytic domain, papain-like cysteine peptidase superfamily [Helianthus annuus]|nr:putative Ulp1 protease family catalytic domain, papain-like cysteine peptidase superfamily [Helianthus annuus]KAJ0663776.1 putative Ulp1 protease family catalytic domain, papain-like cysteine peptidase superfamily [Helianthus annuus]